MDFYNPKINGDTSVILLFSWITGPVMLLHNAQQANRAKLKVSNVMKDSQQKCVHMKYINSATNRTFHTGKIVLVSQWFTLLHK